MIILANNKKSNQHTIILIRTGLTPKHWVRPNYCIGSEEADSNSRRRDKQSAASLLRALRYLNVSLISCNANAHLVNLALLGELDVRNDNGLWSQNTVISAPKIHVRNLFRAQITP